MNVHLLEQISHSTALSTELPKRATLRQGGEIQESISQFMIENPKCGDAASENSNVTVNPKVTDFTAMSTVTSGAVVEYFNEQRSRY